MRLRLGLFLPGLIILHLPALKLSCSLFDHFSEVVIEFLITKAAFGHSEAEGAGLIQPAEEKASKRPHDGLPKVKESRGNNYSHGLIVI